MLTTTFPRTNDDYLARWILELGQELKKIGATATVIAPHAKGLKKSEIIGGIEVQRFKYAPEEYAVLGYGNFLPHESAKSRINSYYICEIYYYLYHF